MEKRIKQFKLKDQNLKQGFKDRVIRNIDMEIEDVSEWWNRLSENNLRVRNEIVNESNSKIWENNKDYEKCLTNLNYLKKCWTVEYDRWYISDGNKWDL